MAVARRSVEVDVPPKKFYQVVVDFENYPEFVNGVYSVICLKESAMNPQVQFEIKLIKKVSYILDFDNVPGKSVRWTLAKKGFFKKNDGSWELEPLDKGKRTRATYTVDIEMGLVPGSILKTITEVNFPKMLGEFKKRAESL